MAIITPSTDSLPYIDRPPSPSSLASAAKLITSATAPTKSRPPHPSLPPSPPTNFSPLIQTELDRLSRNEPFVIDPSSSSSSSSQPPDTQSSTTTATRTGIDSARYASLPTFPDSTTSSSPPSPSTLSSQRHAVRQTSINLSYLRLRAQHLDLLNQYGKNAWLIGNNQLEMMLTSAEKELVELRGEVEAVNRERKAGQEGGRKELEGLEEDWREGVGRVLEVEVAVGRLEEERRGRERGG